MGSRRYFRTAKLLNSELVANMAKNGIVNLTKIYFKTIMEKWLMNDVGIPVELHTAPYNMYTSFTKACQRGCRVNLFPNDVKTIMQIAGDRTL